MTVLEALAILEAAVLECKQRDINTLEVRQAKRAVVFRPVLNGCCDKGDNDTKGSQGYAKPDDAAK